ncbi:FkbM family methyltransferase [Haloactinospora alba]|uniref:FkbM family methyltransferase n=1 Tax=Haloactinospora alba TaxID=405555 RepID=A0A543NG91_9ACTN|nr:FkbM family methyltransferase [Haloactinospora alba]TQN30811.1 FkbM family methyltransferase [Haloactinospora alba]
MFPPRARGRTGDPRLRALAAALRWLAPRAFFVETEVRGISTVVRPGDVCLDIGAKHGLYTFTLADLAGPGGAVYAVEPLHDPVRVLRSGVRLLGAGNVRVVRCALGRESESATMSLPTRRGRPVHGRAYLTSGAHGPGPNAEFSGQRRVTTAVTTLDSLCRDHGITRVDFVKADVEGAEAAMLDGGQEVLSRHRPALMLEIEERHLAKYGDSVASVTDRLRNLGYRMRVWHRGRWRPVDSVTAAHRNYLFLPER